MTHLTCEVTSTAESETFTDLDLGEITVGPMVERPANMAKPVLLLHVTHDRDLGEILCSPAAPGNPRRTAGPPRCRNAKIAGGR
jgi:hypothetical protein